MPDNAPDPTDPADSSTAPGRAWRVEGVDAKTNTLRSLDLVAADAAEAHARATEADVHVVSIRELEGPRAVIPLTYRNRTTRTMRSSTMLALPAYASALRTTSVCCFIGAASLFALRIDIFVAIVFFGILVALGMIARGVSFICDALAESA